MVKYISFQLTIRNKNKKFVNADSILFYNFLNIIIR
ncbi:hypothetical protein A5848_002025, partial [Enterococcus faecium]